MVLKLTTDADLPLTEDALITGKIEDAVCADPSKHARIRTVD